MMDDPTDTLHNLNRLIWMAIFFAGFVIFAFIEWRSAEPVPMRWFLLTSIWSAVSAFGFTAGKWWLLRGDEKRDADPGEDRHV